MSKSKRAALYVRVSTDQQTVENQIRELTAIAEQRGWQIVATYEDKGISGSKGRDLRPGYDHMLTDASKARYDVLMAWGLDRIGRSTIDVLTSLQELEACKVDVFLLKQDIDTTTPAGRMFLRMLAVFGEFERDMIRDRVNAGIARAKAAGVRFGPPSIAAEKEAAIRAALKRGGKGIMKIAAECGVGNGTVSRVRDQMRAEAV